MQFNGKIMEMAYIDWRKNTNIIQFSARKVNLWIAVMYKYCNCVVPDVV